MLKSNLFCDNPSSYLLCLLGLYQERYKPVLFVNLSFFFLTSIWISLTKWHLDLWNLLFVTSHLTFSLFLVLFPSPDLSNQSGCADSASLTPPAADRKALLGRLGWVGGQSPHWEPGHPPEGEWSHQPVPVHAQQSGGCPQLRHVWPCAIQRQ